jgi:hypothetical protein
VFPFLPMMSVCERGHCKIRSVLHCSAPDTVNVLNIAHHDAISDYFLRLCVDVSVIFDVFRDAEIVLSALFTAFRLEHVEQPIYETIPHETGKRTGA